MPLVVGILARRILHKGSDRVGTLDPTAQVVTTFPLIRRLKKFTRPRVAPVPNLLNIIKTIPLISPNSDHPIPASILLRYSRFRLVVVLLYVLKLEIGRVPMHRLLGSKTLRILRGNLIPLWTGCVQFPVKPTRFLLERTHLWVKVVVRGPGDAEPTIAVHLSRTALLNGIAILKSVPGPALEIRPVQPNVPKL